MNMNLEINFSEDENCKQNVAFVKALLIKFAIEILDVSYEQKEELKRKVLNELENT